MEQISNKHEIHSWGWIYRNIGVIKLTIILKYDITYRNGMH